MKNKTVLAIGAHHDDVQIGVGRTMFGHVNNGDQVYIAVTSADEYRTGCVDVRRAEERDALQKMGIPTNNLFIFYNGDITESTIYTLDQIKADVIYIMWGDDTHQAHKHCSTIGQAVSRNIKNVLYYNSGSALNFIPNSFVLDDSFEWKYKLLESFESQIECGAIDIESVKIRERYWADMVKEDGYAEGLIVQRGIL